MKLVPKDLFGHIGMIDPTLDNANAYLKLAYHAIFLKGRPLQTQEIIETAKQHNFWPDHLHGATPHKTLNARLSEHIRDERSNAVFFRTAPATYFLSDIAERFAETHPYKVFHGVARSKVIKDEDILVASRISLDTHMSAAFSEYDETEFQTFFKSECFFKNRSHAEDDSSVKQFVTFTIFHHNELLLIYQRGNFSTASDRLKGAISVGFGGHVNVDDFGLFNQGGSALLYNSSRELLEELYLDDTYNGVDEISARSRILGYINVDDSPDAEHHIAVLVSFSHKSEELPKKGELAINNLRWLDTSKPINDLSNFDLWSRLILERIFQGKLKLETATKP